MKRLAKTFLQWVKGQLGPFLIMLTGVALTTDVFKGFLAAMSNSAENFMVWVKDPIPFARWLVFILAVLLSLFVSWSLRRLLISRSELIQLRSQLAKSDEALRDLSISLEQAREEAREAKADSTQARLELDIARSAATKAKSEPPLSDLDVSVLKQLGRAHRNGLRLTAETLAGMCKEDLLKTENSLQKMCTRKLILQNPSPSGWKYGLAAQGIAFLVENEVE